MKTLEKVPMAYIRSSKESTRSYHIDKTVPLDKKERKAVSSRKYAGTDSGVMLFAHVDTRDRKA